MSRPKLILINYLHDETRQEKSLKRQTEASIARKRRKRAMKKAVFTNLVSRLKLIKADKKKKKKVVRDRYGDVIDMENEYIANLTPEQLARRKQFPPIDHSTKIPKTSEEAVPPKQPKGWRSDDEMTKKPKEEIRERQNVGSGRSIRNVPTKDPEFAFDQEAEVKRILDADKETVGKKKKKKKAIVTNIHSRLKSLDFLLMGKKRKLAEMHDTTEDEQEEVSREQETHNTPTDLGYKFESASGLLGEKDSLKPLKQRKRDKRRKKSFLMRVKDGEFGGMNTGETEWTEPRDTVNDRRDSNLKKKAKKKLVGGKRPDGSIPWDSPLRDPKTHEILDKPKEEKTEEYRSSQRRYTRNPDKKNTPKQSTTNTTVSGGRKENEKGEWTGEGSSNIQPITHRGGRAATEEREKVRVGDILDTKAKLRAEREKKEGPCKCEACRARRAKEELE